MLHLAAQGFAPYYFFLQLSHQFCHDWLAELPLSLEEEKVLVLDADCLQGMVLVRCFLVKEPSWICMRVVCMLFSTIFCKRTEVGKKSFHAVHLQKERLNVSFVLV